MAKNQKKDFVAPTVEVGEFKDVNADAIVKAIMAPGLNNYEQEHLGFASGDKLTVVSTKGNSVVLHGQISGHRKVDL